MAIFRIPINLAWNAAGSPGVNVWHVRDDAWPGSTNLDEALTVLSDFYADLASTDIGILADQLRYSLGDIVELESKEYVSPDPLAFVPGTATTADGLGPTPLQICVSWRTSSATRRGMGRTFIGPLRRTAAASDGTPTDSHVTALRNAAQTIIDHNNSPLTSSFGIYGASDGATKTQIESGDYPRVLRDITGFRVRDNFAVLRSRRD